MSSRVIYDDDGDGDDERGFDSGSAAGAGAGGDGSGSASGGADDDYGGDDYGDDDGASGGSHDDDDAEDDDGPSDPEGDVPEYEDDDAPASASGAGAAGAGSGFANATAATAASGGYGSPPRRPDGGVGAETAGSSPLAGASADILANITMGAGGEKKPKDCRMLPSLFAHRKPTVLFDYPTYLGIGRNLPDDIPALPPGSKKTPHFRIHDSVHEYNCVRNALLRAGLKRTNGSGWNVLWSKHLHEEEFLRLNPYQKVNHFPGTWAIGRKDRLAQNMARMKRDFGDHFDFHSKSHILPGDRPKLRAEMEADPKALWILKPCASSCGRGIRLASHAAGSSIPKGKAYLAQKYVRHPYLIDSKKFDLRIYVLVTCFDPLRVYLFHDGLVRFCTEKYNTSTKNIKNRFAHLTNYSVNKKSEKFDRNQDATKDGAGSKWSLQALRRWFKEHGIDDVKVMANIKDVIIKTLISCESHVGSLCQRYFSKRTHEHPGSNCFEVFGFDVLLDKHLKAWILEVNVSPSLSSSSPMDKKIKNTLMTDVFHLIGVQAFDAKKHEKDLEKAKSDRLLGLGRSTRGLLRHRNIRDLSHIGPADLLPDELAVICETEEELSRRGHFQRIFPAENAAYYLQFFETPRFNNVLLLMWLSKWKAMCDTGSIPRPIPGSTAGGGRASSGRSGRSGGPPRPPGSLTRVAIAGSARSSRGGSSRSRALDTFGSTPATGFGRDEVLDMISDATRGTTPRASSRGAPGTADSASSGRRAGKKAEGGFVHGGESPYGNMAVIAKRSGRGGGVPAPAPVKKAGSGRKAKGSRDSGRAGASRNSGASSAGGYSDRSSVSTGSSVGGPLASSGVAIVGGITGAGTGGGVRSASSTGHAPVARSPLGSPAGGPMAARQAFAEDSLDTAMAGHASAPAPAPAHPRPPSGEAGRSASAAGPTSSPRPRPALHLNVTAGSMSARDAPEGSGAHGAARMAVTPTRLYSKEHEASDRARASPKGGRNGAGTTVLSRPAMAVQQLARDQAPQQEASVARSGPHHGSRGSARLGSGRVPPGRMGRTTPRGSTPTGMEPPVIQGVSAKLESAAARSDSQSSARMVV